MINRILSNPQNLYLFLPLVFITMLVIYEITYKIISRILMSDIEGQKLFLAEEYKVKPEDISEEILMEAIDATSIWWGNAVLIVTSIIVISLTLLGF